MHDGYRWEDRGIREYYIDATGRIVGEILYYLSDGKYGARANGKVVGEYVNDEDARRAVEYAIAQPPIPKPDNIPELPE